MLQSGMKKGGGGGEGTVPRGARGLEITSKFTKLVKGFYQDDIEIFFLNSKSYSRDPHARGFLLSTVDQVRMGGLCNLGPN